MAEGGWSWLRAKTVGRNDREENRRIIETIKEKDKRIEEKERTLSEVKGKKEELEDRLSDFERITHSLKRDSLARNRLIERYWKPLHAVVICFSEQKVGGTSETWLQNELEEKYSLHKLTGFTYIIPPADVPSRLKGKHNSREQLQEWIEDDLYSDNPQAMSTICFCAVVDLQNVYSRTDHPLESRSHFFSTIDEELSLDDIFDEDDFSSLLASDGVNLSKVVESGDIPFLASKAISPEELDKLHDNQSEIEEMLGNPNLREIACDIEPERVSSALEPYVANPDQVAESVVKEAQIWERELY